MDVCAICGQPEDHVNHDTYEAFGMRNTYEAFSMRIGHEFESTKEVD